MNTKAWIVGAVAAGFLAAPVAAMAVTYANIALRFDISEGVKVGKGTTLYTVFDKGTNATCYVAEGKAGGISCLSSQQAVGVLTR